MKELLAIGLDRNSNKLVGSFCDAVVKLVTLPGGAAGGLTGTPQGGQHLTGANRLMRQKYPLNKAFHTLYGHLFLPMPVVDLEQVIII